MNGTRKRVDFTVDEWHYVWLVTRDNQVAFCLEESNYKTNMVPWDELMIGWDDDDVIVSFDQTGVCRKPVEVIRRAADLTLEWIKTAKPPYFWFDVASPKKRSIYRRLIDRYRADVLAEYQIVEYDDALYFYKEARARPDGARSHASPVRWPTTTLEQCNALKT